LPFLNLRGSRDKKVSGGQIERQKLVGDRETKGGVKNNNPHIFLRAMIAQDEHLCNSPYSFVQNAT